MSRKEQRIALYRTPPQVCGYLPNLISSNVFVDPELSLNRTSYGSLLSQGFRRSGRHVYRPWCDNCQACVPIRLPVSEYTPNRSQRRAQKANADLTVKVSSARFEDSHYDLYRRYTAARHEDGEMAEASPQEYADFLISPWSDTRFLELWKEEQLLAIAVTDVVSDGLSAVYTFFDPSEAKRSLGAYAIQCQIQFARSLGLDWLYLGYWIRDCRKMAYKQAYQPLELLQNGRWQRLAANQQRGQRGNDD